MEYLWCGLYKTVINKGTYSSESWAQDRSSVNGGTFLLPLDASTQYLEDGEWKVKWGQECKKMTYGKRKFDYDFKTFKSEKKINSYKIKLKM